MTIGIQFVYLLSDYAGFDSFDRNYNVLLFFSPYSNYRGIIWTLVLVCSTIFVRYLSKMRAAILLEMQYKCSIENFSVMLMNIPSETQDYEVKTMFFNLLGYDAVVKYFRVENPQFLGARRRLYRLEKEYFDYLKICSPRMEGRCDFCRYSLSKRVLQRIGYLRDMAFYRREIARQRAAVERLERRARTRLDAIIVTLDSQQAVRRFVRRFGQSRGVGFHGRRAVLRRAPGPTDIILENLHYEGALKHVKVAVSYVIVALVSLLFFVVVGFCRFYMRGAKSGAGTLRDQNSKYYGLFLLQLAFDVCLRPVLYAMTNFERHYSYSAKEKLWMIKLYMYTGLNKLSLYYSRSFLQLLRIFETKGLKPSFFNIYDFTKQWRVTIDSGGMDALLYTVTAVLAYPAIDLIEYCFYYVLMCSMARTENDVIQASQCLPERYASRYVCIIVMFTFMLSFGHAQPLILLIVPLYFVLHYFTSRVVLLRLARPPPKTQIISQQAENLMYFAVIFATVSLCQSYLPINRFTQWCTACLPPMILLVVATRFGVLDFLFGENIIERARRANRVSRDTPLDLQSCDNYVLAKEEVNVEML